MIKYIEIVLHFKRILYILTAFNLKELENVIFTLCII